jgi:hypothetical protein
MTAPTMLMTNPIDTSTTAITGARLPRDDASSLIEEGAIDPEERPREARAAAVARHPHAIIFDASAHLAAPSVLLKEAVEIADQRGHGAA